MRKRSCGFSLIEMVVTIVIMSIISVGLVGYIVNSASGYAQTSARNQLAAAGRLVIDRLSMELHNALPESVRISTPLNATDQTNGDGFAGDQCIEFIPVLAATTYINPAIRPDTRKTTFEVINFVPTQNGVTGAYAVIYPTSAADLYQASFAGNTQEAIAGVTSITDPDDPDGVGPLEGPDGRKTITTTTNHRFKRASSVDRVFLTRQPVSFCVSGTKLYRYENYGFSNTAVPLRPRRPNGTCAAATCLPNTTPNRALISDQLNNAALTGGGSQAFDQLAASRRRNGVIQLELVFSQDGQTLSLNHEVMQQVTP